MNVGEPSFVDICVATIGVCLFQVCSPIGDAPFLFYKILGGLKFMASLNEKIVAITELMNKGIITAEELTKIIQVLNSGDAENVQNIKTPMENKYETFMKNTVAMAFKSPSSVKFPPLESSMIKEGEMKISAGLGSKTHNLRYIHTYIDASNSYGAMLREEIAIVIDDNFNFTMVLQALKNPFTGKSLGQWTKLPGVEI